MSVVASILAEVDRRLDRRLGQVRGAIRAVVESVSATPAVAEASVEALADERVTVELFQHTGFRSIPAAGAELVLVQVGSRGGHLVAIASADRSSAPVDLVEGDAALYAPGSPTTRVWCKADGTIEIEAASGASVQLTAAGELVLNGGSLGVARSTDTCSPSVGMTAWISSVSGALATLTGGAFPPPTDATYSISSASTTVKAG